jgi:DnaK suppressor protein
MELSEYHMWWKGEGARGMRDLLMTHWDPIGVRGIPEPADEFDAANLASDLYQDELEEGLAGDLRSQLEAIERAEQRLADGAYGLSLESGEPIPDERLEALPTAELTVEEERRRRA